jgi:hypothetical protein
MISTLLFLSFIILVIATPQLVPVPPQQPPLQQQTNLKICSPADILMSFLDPHRVMKEYLCSSA